MNRACAGFRRVDGVKRNSRMEWVGSDWMSAWLCGLAALLCAMTLLLLGNAASAGEPAANGKKAAPAGQGEAADGGAKSVDDESDDEAANGESDDKDKPLSAMSISELMRYQSFNFYGGGRDPFCFRKKVVKEAATAETPNGEPVAVNRLTEWSKDKIQDFLVSKATVIEELIRMHDYKQAVTESEQVKSLAGEKWGGRPSDPEMDRIYQRVLSYGRTAARLNQAEETRKEFEELPITIKGIRWSPQGSLAIVNDQICEPGAALTNLPGKAQVQVETIDAGGVSFVFKGQKFRKAIDQEEEKPGNR